MQVILLENIRNLGGLGETVNVKSGFGRNFLIPYGKAVFSSKENAAAFEERRAELEKKEQEKLSVAQNRAQQLAALSLSVEVLASEEGKLYGSVGISEVIKLIGDLGVEVSRKEVSMPTGPVHTVGEYSIDIQLHSDVMLSLDLVVASSEKHEVSEDEKLPESDGEEDFDYDY
jgi:large subunit ribosomal protein L9